MSDTGSKDVNNIQGIKATVKGGGRCIYCGSDGGNDGLRDEHIMPYSLSGNTVLLKASCRVCEGITSRLDGYLAHATFGHLRPHANVQSRSGYPKTLPAVIQRSGEERVVDLMTEDHPFFTNMPVWDTPGIMRGAAPTDVFDPCYAHVYWYVPPNMKEILNLENDEDARVRDASRIPNVPLFARAIAKIAYGHAVFMLGLDGFRPLALPDIILGKYPNIPYFIGSEMDQPSPPEERGRMHSIQLLDVFVGRMKYLVVRLRLFAHSGTAEFGMPFYNVVVGQRFAPKALSRRGALILPRSISL